MTPMAHAWTLFSGPSILKRRLTWTNDNPFAGSEVYGDVYQVVGVPLYTDDECKARAEAAEKALDQAVDVGAEQVGAMRTRAEAAEKREAKTRAALEIAMGHFGDDMADAFIDFVESRAALEAKP